MQICTMGINHNWCDRKTKYKYLSLDCLGLFHFVPVVVRQKMRQVMDILFVFLDQGKDILY